MKTRFIKFVSILVAISFGITSTVTASPIGSVCPSLSQGVDIGLERFNELFIPENYGTILKKWHAGGSNKWIIHIQDAHCHYETQHNIAKILEVLVRDYNVDLVAIEGAAGDLSLERFGKLEDINSKELV